ncbi:hypothetical protein [Streptomyces sp. LBL]|uniref:hypothetical protein n=1 Tax=Streptomyces sp. LBL TaxID=2940562 RepID=UPI0024759F83|nr:hypothetical protein [Streptomyces sp. LBL]
MSTTVEAAPCAGPSPGSGGGCSSSSLFFSHWCSSPTGGNRRCAKPGERGHPKGGHRQATTGGLPPLSALGLDGGDEAGAGPPGADLPQQVRTRHRTLDRLRADGTDPHPVGVPARTHDQLAHIRRGKGSLSWAGSCGM